MATKRLARTAIEGGRTGYSKYARRYSHGDERAWVRDELRRRLADPAVDDAKGIEPRDVVRRDFADKLGPPRRWLERQVGQPWAEVYAELKRRFDPRTTAGRHLVYDHMLRWIRWGEHDDWGWCRFEVDAAGILRARPRRQREPNEVYLRWRQEAEARGLVGARLVGARGEHLFWFEPAGRPEARTSGAFRQAHRLSDDEAAVWRGLLPAVRELFTYLHTAGQSTKRTGDQEPRYQDLTS